MSKGRWWMRHVLAATRVALQLSPPGRASKPEIQLGPGKSRRTEQRRVELHASERIQPQAPVSDVESVSNELRDRSRAAHARAEIGVVVTAAAYILNQRHDMRCTLRMMLRQPLTE